MKHEKGLCSVVLGFGNCLGFSNVMRKELIRMVRVSIGVHDGTARFAVAVLAKSIQQALSIVAAQYPGSLNGRAVVCPNG